MKTPIWESSAGALAAFMALRPPIVRIVDLYTCDFAGDINGGDDLTFTTSDVSVTVPYGTSGVSGPLAPVAPVKYSAAGLYFDQLQNKATGSQKVGLDVNTWQVIAAPAPGFTIGGVPFLQAVSAGFLDGSVWSVDRAYFDVRAGFPGTLVGIYRMFAGPAAGMQVGRSNVVIALNDWRVKLTTNMPRNLFQATCRWQLYGAGCTLDAASFAQAGTIAASTGSNLLSVSVGAPGGSGTYALGYLAMTSGLNRGLARKIAGWSSGAAPSAPSYTSWDQTPAANYDGAFGQVIAFSPDGLTVTVSNESGSLGDNNANSAIEGKSTGKFHFEVTTSGWKDSYLNADGIGFLSSSPYLGAPGDGVGIGGGGAFFKCDAHSSSFPAFGGSQTLAIEADLGAKLMWINIAGTWYGSASGADPATGTNGIDISAAMANAPLFPAVIWANYNSARSARANFGQSPFVVPVSSGFTAGWTATASIAGSFRLSAQDIASHGTVTAPAANDEILTQIPVPAGLQISGLEIVFTGSGTQNWKAILKDNTGAGGGPGAVLASSSASPSFAAGRNAVSFGSSYTTPAAGYVWAGIITDSGGGSAHCPVAGAGGGPTGGLTNALASAPGNYASPGPVASYTYQNATLPVRLTASLASVDASFILASAFPLPLSMGDTFNAYPGCSHLLNACIAFDNQQNFGGFPYIPVPESAA